MATNALFWPVEREAELRRLWDAKLSCRVIAGELGISRNAVIGKAHRLGLEAREKVVRKPRGPRKPRGLYTRHKRDVLGKLFAPDEFIPRAVSVEPLDYDFDKVVEENGCRYAITKEMPHFFCGHPKQAGSSYCPTHHALCWKPATSVNREQYHLTRIERFRAYKADVLVTA